MVVDRIQALQARGLRASVSCQLLTQLCSQFLDDFCPEAIHSSLTHGPPPHGLLLHQTQQGLPEWQCMTLCKIILKISYCLCNILFVRSKSLVLPTLKKGIIQTVSTGARGKDNWNHPSVWLVKPKVWEHFWFDGAPFSSQRIFKGKMRKIISAFLIKILKHP